MKLDTRALNASKQTKLLRRPPEPGAGVFLIEGGLYSETAMREAKSKNTVYSRHQGLSKQAT